MKIAVITGGSSGLGKAMAKYLAARNYDIAILARNPQKLAKAKDEILTTSTSKKVETLVADITSTIDMQAAAATIKNQFDKIDFLILDAGILQVKLLLDYRDLDELKEVIDVNLWGTILSTRLLLPLVKEGGKILLISSGFGLMGAAGYTTYCASKAGIINFAEALRRELLTQKIDIYVACPPDIETPQYAHEIATIPSWMHHGKKRSKVLSADKAAKMIMTACSGSSRVINIGKELKLFAFFKKVLPIRVLQYILDRILPTKT